MSDEDFRNAVMLASRRPDVHEAVARVYGDLQAAIELRRPRCVQSGRCCRFEEFGHRLYVTTMELAAFVAQLSQAMRPELADAVAGWSGAGCPFQLNRLCGAHAIRPLGCRIFFCDDSSASWQQERYEAMHARLKQLHEELAVPYNYREWRRALGIIGIAVGANNLHTAGLSSDRYAIMCVATGNWLCNMD